MIRGFHAVGSVTLCLLCMNGARAAPAQEAPWPTTLQVSLSVPLQSYRLKPGAPVFASVLSAWQSPGCSLKPGATVSGTVVDVHAATKGQSGASMAVTFDRADCDGRHDVPVHFALFALINGVNASDLPKDASRLYGASSSRVGLGKGGAALVSADFSNQNGARDQNGGLAVPVPKTIARGEVLGAGKVKLDVATGSQETSVLSDKRDFTIYPRAELVLLAYRDKEAVAPHPDPPLGTLASAAAEDRPKVEPEDATDAAEVCSADSCSTVKSEPQGVETEASRVVGLQAFGYHPRRFSNLYGFNQDTTVTFLSARLVLVTFDLHRLRQRASWPFVVRRTVRGVLLDAETGTVQKSVDWVVEGEGKYIWYGGGGRTLIHVNGELHEIGPDLQAHLRIPARGNLLWVTASPSGSRIEVATLRERHTFDVHRQIEELSSTQPEEDAVVNVYDRAGGLLATRVSSTRERPPVLLDDGGQMEVVQAGGESWRIEKQDGPKALLLAKVHSSCRPSLSEPSSSALFVVGCSPGRGQWFRMLRSDGRTILQAKASAQQIAHRAVASGADAYAVGYVRMNVSTLPGALIKNEDIAGEQLAVYSAKDGHLLTTKRLRSFPQVRESFAPSPDGTRLAALTDAGVAIYDVPAR